MTWVTSVPRETAELLHRLKDAVIAESERQNLVSAATIPQFDERHLLDSLQLLPHLQDGVLVDIGSGGGFPGMVLACCREDPIHLVEPRAKRATFLDATAQALGIGQRVTVHASKIERVALPPVRTITARAVASLDALFGMAAHLADESTRWVLPKGRSAASELEAARQTWQGTFRLVPSITDSEAAIVIAEGVRRRRAR
ncbi:16S rRNA (guanine(527)-N(7))-methyltransferase RsmG [Sphingomonas oligoaromativorans]|uniref:16S rRNA (guanine(527)-N(7))-methyltransferase RsmG n=1 Tax=Sphingomonas oligoaromativorans TaxID=575322 RepID=UPI00141EF7FF|nr:16S rRNA (guanine(527)-N(7))-methyltransferase RsmG [Sphingomonas oligoaromativorans]NIJ34574.1 16S rRNA (guanine527-N7)-methyltransferase [Sphingomonas oligoaromativorans]